jgi:hypothetical protein
MTEFDEDAQVEWIAREARRPVYLAEGARSRIMAAVRAASAPRRSGLAWLVSPRSLAMSPLAGGLLAAGFVGIGVLAGLTVINRDGRLPPTEQSMAVAPRPELPVQMKFVLDAPRAGHVSLVGDFNGWDKSITPMTRSSDGTWTVSLALVPGRHVYAFVLDGRRWVPDPTALVAPDDGFGARNSIVLVNKKGPST